MAKRAPKETTAPALTDAQVAARVTTIDDARQTLVDAGTAAAQAQSALDALAPDATDEQRHEAIVAVDAAELAVQDARVALEKLVAEPVTLPPAEAATVMPDLATLAADPGFTFITEGAQRILKVVEDAVGAGEEDRALAILDEEIAAADQFITALKDLQEKLFTRRQQIAPQFTAPDSATPEDWPGHPIRVIGPKAGRRRAGRSFTDTAQDIFVTDEELALLEADPTLTVSHI